MPNELTVHVLRHGRALCPLEGIPRDWPPDHRWCSIGDLEPVNCEPCKRAALTILAQKETDAPSAARSSGT